MINKLISTVMFISIFGVISIFANDNILRITDVNATPGDQIDVFVQIDNDDQFKGFQFDITIPAGFTYVANSGVLTGRENGHSLSASLVGTDVLRVLCFSFAGAAFNGNSGDVMKFSLTTPVVAGLHDIDFSGTVSIGSLTNQNLLTDTIGGEILLCNDITSQVNPTNVLCYNGNDGAIDLTVTNGISPYSFNWDNTYTSEDLNNLSAGIYNVTITDNIGCTGTNSTTLTAPTSLITGTDVVTACDSYQWIDGQTYTMSNSTAQWTVEATNGCDSLVTLNLTIIPSSTGIDEITACDSYQWIDGNTYTTSNSTATHTLVAANGCDSVVTLNLTILNSNVGTDTQVACDSYTWIDGNTYLISNNTATYTLQNALGCDSVVTLDLTVNYSNTGIDTQVACDSYTWIDGQTYTQSNNSATHTLTNVDGCDSVVTLDLTVNYSNTGIDTQVACDSYTWIDGYTYTQSNNTATYTLTNVDGCDSVVTLDLTINYSNTGIDTQIACDSYMWIDGNTYTVSNNTATHTLQNVDGCDSVVTLNLTINYSNTGIDTQVACDSYTWIDGNTYTISNNTATHTLQNVDGCDSVVTLDLTVYYSPLVSDVTMDYAMVGDTYGTTGGDFTNGFEICVDGNSNSHYNLDVNTFTANVGLYVDSLNPFYLDVTNIDPSYYAYWANRGVVSGASGWEGLMWEIINGNQPITYLVYNGSDYVLLDGLQYLLGNIETLVIPGDYPALDYLFEGTVVSENECVSDEFSITLKVNEMPIVSDFSLQMSVDGTNWNSAGGDYANGFELCLENDGAIHYMLDVDAFTSNVAIASSVMNEFYLDVNSVGQDFYAYWATRGVISGASGWQGVMWEIINGNQPITYLVFDGSDYTLVDGLQYQYAGQTTTLVIPGDYPSLDYVFTGNVLSAEGCTSADFSMTLKVNKINYGIDTQVACDSYTWINGQTYIQSNNTATHTLTNVDGCDSVVTLNLTINYSNTGIDTQVACDSYTWIDGYTYTQSNNTAIYTLTNVDGCDSVVTLDLTINYTPVVNNVSIDYSNDELSWLGTAGDYTNGFEICLDGNGSTDYFLDVNTLSVTEGLMVNNMNAFSLDVTSLDASYYSYWAAKGVVSGASGWQGVMWEIINGNQPITYLVFDGSDYTLIDGLQYQYAGQTTTLLLPGDYPALDYEFKGTVLSAEGCESDDFSITLKVGITPIVSIDATDITCYGIANGVLTANVSLGELPYSYLWDNAPASTTASAASLDVGSYSVTVTEANGCVAIASGSITEPAELIINVDDYMGECSGGIGELTVDVQGGTSPYSYLWSNDSITSTIVDIAEGTYTVTVTDANSCSKVTSGIVDNPAPVFVEVSNDTLECFGANDGELQLTVSGGTGTFNFVWNNQETTQNLSGLTAGEYNVTVTDANGCDATAQAFVIQPSEMVSTLMDVQLACYNDANGSLSISVTGGTSPYSYLWSNTEETESISGLIAGEYSVVVSDDNGCILYDTALVNQPDELVAVGQIDQNISCFGYTNGQATAVITGGTMPYSYNWSILNQTSSISGVGAGTYYVTVSDANGCDVSYPVVEENVVWFQPSSTGLNHTILVQSSVAVTINSQTFNFESGDYVGVFYDSLGTLACGGFTTWDPSGNNFISVWGSEPGMNNGFASGESFSWKLYDVSSGETYDLDATYLSVGFPNQDGFAVNGMSAAETLTGSSNQGSNSIEIILTEPNQLTGVINSSIYNGYNISCNGYSNGDAIAEISGGTPGYTYVWSNNDLTQNISGLVAGNYQLTVSDINNCTIILNTTLNEPSELSVSLSTDGIDCYNGTTNIYSSVTGDVGDYSYMWNTFSSLADLSNVIAGTYSVEVTDGNGCTATDAITITEPDTLIATAVAVDLDCYGNTNGSIDLTVAGGTMDYTYAWSNNATTQDLNGLGIGNYEVTVTDENGCLAYADAEISQPDELVVDNINSTSAVDFYDNGTAEVIAIGGTTPYTYLWSNGDETAFADSLTDDWYFVTVTDINSCSVVDSVLIIREASQPLSAGVFNYGDVSCFGGSDGSAFAFQSGGIFPYTYLWSDGQTAQIAEGLPVGNHYVVVSDFEGTKDTAYVDIFGPTQITTNVVLDVEPLCYGDANGQATVTANGGTPSYSFLWDTQETSATAIMLNAGWHFVTVTDNNSCSVVDSIEVTEPDLFEVNVSVDNNVSCYNGNDGMATASIKGGTGTANYTWSNSATGAVNSGLAAGWYYVTAIDGNGCTDIDSIFITQPDELLATASVFENVSCFGLSDGIAVVTYTGGTGAVSYNWSVAGNTEDTLEALAAGTYYVTVTDMNSCTSVSSVEITQPNVLMTQTSVISDVSCFEGDNGSAEVTYTGGTDPVSYLWSNNETTQSVSGLVAGSYLVTVTDANNCTSINGLAIAEPTELITSVIVDSNVSCYGYSDGGATVSVSGGTTGYSYLWSSSDVAESAVDLIAGKFFVTVTDGNSCSAIDSITITQPDPFTVSFGIQNDVSCYGYNDGIINTVVNGGTAPYEYAWSNSSTMPTAIGLGPDDYSVTVTDANMCEAYSATATISEPDTLIASISYSLNEVCFDDEGGAAGIEITGGFGDYSILWSNSEITDTIYNLADGLYTVQVTDENNCLANAQVEILGATQDLNLAFDITDVFAYQGSDGEIDITVTGGYSTYNYSWSNNAISFNSTDEDLANLVAGSYDITVTDFLGCYQSTTVTVEDGPTEPVWNVSPAPDPHLITMPASITALIDGTPVSLGDYLGVFYGDVCGGFIEYTGVSQQLYAQMDDLTTSLVKEGFAAGEEFVWKVWKLSENKYYNAYAVYQQQGFPNTWDAAYNGASKVTHFYGISQQTISLDQGWNLMSSYIDPVDSDMDVVFSDLISNNEVFLIKDELGQVIIPSMNANTIDTFFDYKQGYYVNMNIASDLTVYGDLIHPQNNPLELTVGWNYLAYIRTTQSSTMEVLDGIKEKVYIIKDDKGFVALPSFNWYQQLPDLIPGEAYQIQLVADTALTYIRHNGIMNYAKSGNAYLPTTHFATLENTGNDMTVFIPSSAWNKLPNKGDEIAIFDEFGTLIGSNLVSEDNVAVTIWGDDNYTQSIDGAVEGDKFIIKLWRNNTGLTEEILVDEWLQGDDKYRVNQVSIVKSLTVVESEQFTLSNAQPNPCSVSTLINVSLPVESDITLNVYNSQGKLVKQVVNGTYNSGIYNFEIYVEDLEAGIYNYRLSSGANSITKRFTVIR